MNGRFRTKRIRFTSGGRRDCKAHKSTVSDPDSVQTVLVPVRVGAQKRVAMNRGLGRWPRALNNLQLPLRGVPPPI